MRADVTLFFDALMRMPTVAVNCFQQDLHLAVTADVDSKLNPWIIM